MAILSGVSVAEVGESTDFIREVHHQVKNTLQVVCSLLRLEGRGVADPLSQELIRRSEGRVQAMALVYDTLYKAGAYLEVPLEQYLRSVAEQIVRGWRGAGRELVLEYSVEPMIVSTKGAISCGLILNELLTGLREDNSCTALRVVGGSLQRGVFIEVAIKPSGEEPPDRGTLSAQIVNALAQQYGGRMQILKTDWLQYRVELPTLTDP